MTSQQARRAQGYETVTFTPEITEHNSSTLDVMCLEDVNWYHGDMSRTGADTMLQEHGVEGSYLLRKSKRHEGYSVSVKTQGVVKHYMLTYDNRKHRYDFGNATFHTLKDLLDHFASHPILTKENGVVVTLRQPFANDFEEIDTYEITCGHGQLKKGMFEDKPAPKPDNTASKAGYLHKRGNIHKNWNERWFIAEKRTLKYFRNKEAGRPIKVIDLSTATSVAEDGIDNKKNCFRLVLPNRTFYFYAPSPSVAKEWIDFFQFKINYYKSEDV